MIGFATHVAFEAQPGEKKVEVLGIVINFKGAVMETTVDRLQKLGAGRKYINHLIVSTLVAGWNRNYAGISILFFRWLQSIFTFLEQVVIQGVSPWVSREVTSRQILLYYHFTMFLDW